MKFICLIVFSISLFAQDSKSNLTIDDIIKSANAGSFSISTTGKKVVWSQSRYVKDKDGFVNDLYMFDTQNKKQIQLTHSDYSDSSPIFMKNDSVIVFSSNRKPISKEMKGKGSQLWMLPLYGGEIKQITDFKFGHQGFEKHNENEVVIKLRDSESQREKTKKENKDDAIVVDEIEHDPSTNLYLFNLIKMSEKKITFFTDNVESWVVSRSGKFAITSHTQSGSYRYDEQFRPRIFLTNLENNSSEELFKDVAFYSFGFIFDQSESGFYFMKPYSTNPPYTSMSVNELFYYDLNKKSETKIYTNFEKEIASYTLNPTKSGFLIAYANGMKNYIYKMTGKKSDVKFTKISSKFQGNIWSMFSSERSDNFVLGYSTVNQPMEYYHAKLSNTKIENAQKMTNFASPKKNYGQAEFINWIGALNETVEGILHYPKDYQKGKKYPLLVQIHGGPASANIDAYAESWAYYPRYMSQHRNSFTLMINYHGSSRYGLKWVESIRGHYYDYPFIDINNGVDHVIAQGLVNPDSMAIMGWSNGAILSTDAVTKTNRYKATVPGAGDNNWFSDFGNCAFGASFDIDYFQGVPWKDFELYKNLSPFFRMEKITTPTLLFHGTNDTAVPTEQSWQHYRAMQQIGQTPVKLVLFPGEPHGLRRTSHQLRKIEEEIAWLDKYLYLRADKSDKIWTKSSPLAEMLSRDKVSNYAGNYGEFANMMLMPQMVKIGKTSVSMFEITQAQYYNIMQISLKKDLAHPNKPMSGLSFDDVNSFISKLNTRTGKSYRLPNESEMIEWIEKSKQKENNLSYWIGFTPSDRDQEQLNLDLKSINSTDLIMDVFSFGHYKHNALYDINGNVAEYTSKGKVMGGYVLFDNSKNDVYVTPNNTSLIGFRVVLDEN